MKTNSPDEIRRVIASRTRLYDGLPPTFLHKAEEEGGCGVTGFACTIPVAGRHIFTPSKQMHNRGNGKGGGIAAVGFDPDQLGISRDVLESHYCLQIAALDPECIGELAAKHIRSVFDIAAESKLKTVKNWRELPSLEVRPPDIFRYFVRVKPDALDAFIAANQLQAMDRGRRAHARFYLDRHDDGRSRDRCFVATLVFGEAPETRVLRRFRDQVMRPRPLGRGLIALYYRSGPKVCGFLERRPRLRPIVRWMLSGFASFAARWLEWQEHLHDQ